jgi:hypothetical protein
MTMLGLRLASALLAMLVTTTVAAAKPDKPDCSASLASVQEAVMVAGCDCATAATHGQYVRCAGKAVKAMVADGALDRRCKGAMVRGFAKSTCGKADAVTCCTAKGCKVKKSSVCERLGGTVGVTPFCSDACAAGSPSGAFVE